MRHNSLFLDGGKQIKECINKALSQGVFPGAAIAFSCYKEGRMASFSAVFGNATLFPHPQQLSKDTFFDLASLTKPFATVLSLLCLIQEGTLSLDETLPSLLERDVLVDKKNITLRHLLNHCSGFADHHPYYKKLITVDEAKRKEFLLDTILKEELVYPIGSKDIYSDLGFFLLGQIIELKSGKSLETYVHEKVMDPLGLADNLLFRPIKKGKKNFAATEKCPWRKKVLSGEVHDDNTYALGGVSGQAGLFGSVDAVLNLTSFLLDMWKGRASHPNFSGSLLKEFFTRQHVKESTWALGFDTPSQTGSSAGKYISQGSIGHLGFTGTSFWIDPRRELVMVLLTNRVHPSRENMLIQQFRPLFHDTVLKCLKCAKV